jgi:hypothetical protein
MRSTRLTLATAGAGLILGGALAAPTVDAHPAPEPHEHERQVTLSCYTADWVPMPCPPSPDPERCTEDMPCWDPCTMGNRYGWTTAGVWVDCREMGWI